MNTVALIQRIETGMTTAEDAERVWRLMAAVAHLIDLANRHGLAVDERAVDALIDAMRTEDAPYGAQ